MVIPATAVAILTIGICLFFFSPRLLYAAMVISVPFSATVVVNFQSGGEQKGVAAWLFLAGLWVFREVVSGSPPWHKKGWFSTRQSRYGLLAFLVAVLLSLCIPLVLNGTSWVPDPDPTGNGSVALRFGMYNITQTAYLAFGIFLAIFVAAETCQPSKLFFTLRLYVGSCTFAAAWGLFEFWCNVTGHAYPAYIFNTGAGVSALGYKEALTLGIGRLGRVSSVALEPSVLAEELLIAFVLLLVSKGLRRPILSKKWDFVATAMILAALLVSTSTTAYAGILIALFIVAITLSRAGKPSKLYFILGVTIVAFGVFVALTVPVVYQIADMMILTKFQSGSGLGRLHSVLLAAQDFLRYPIFGAGWHAVNCWDLVFLILANTGFVGLLAFGYFLVPVLRGLWGSAASEKSAALLLFPTVMLMVVLAEFAGLTYATGYVWLVFGLGAAGVVAARREGSRDAIHQVRTLSRPLASLQTERGTS